MGVKGIQLVTISRPTAYGEYAPYTFAKDEQEFQDVGSGHGHLTDTRKKADGINGTRKYQRSCILLE